MAESEHKSNFNYDASVPAAAIFSVVFGLILITHVYQSIKHKTVFMIPLVIACFMETFGYITRILTIKNPDPVWIIIVSETQLVTAPAFLAAQSYMIVGRMISYTGPGYAIISHGWITKIFVVCDVIAILTQASGGATLAGSDTVDSLKIAKIILIAGLALQVIVFGIFFFVAGHFDYRARQGLGKSTMQALRPLFTAFYVSAILITGRSIYRTVEFATITFTPGDEDPQGYAITHEWCLYIFDTLPIMFSILAFNVYHPGAFLPRKKGLRIDGTFEEQKKRTWFRLSRRRGDEEASGTVTPTPETSFQQTR